MLAPRPLLISLLACAGLAASACGASDQEELRFIAQSRAEALIKSVDSIEADLGSGDCESAVAGLDPLREQVEALPKATDGKLVANLFQWVDQLGKRIPQDCEAATEEPTVTPDPTETPSATPTPEEEPTETATPEATPEPSATPDATSTPESGEPEAPANGGVEGEG